MKQNTSHPSHKFKKEKEGGEEGRGISNMTFICQYKKINKTKVV